MHGSLLEFTHNTGNIEWVRRNKKGAAVNSSHCRSGHLDWCRSVGRQKRIATMDACEHTTVIPEQDSFRRAGNIVTNMKRSLQTTASQRARAIVRTTPHNFMQSYSAGTAFTFQRWQRGTLHKQQLARSFESIQCIFKPNLLLLCSCSR